jgi:AGCS family alanine or glycine:cation symporter
MELLGQVIDFLNTYIWSTAMVVFVLGTAIYFSIRLKFSQLRYVKVMAREVLSSKNSESGISTFASFCTTMAARVGVGNIAGVAVAIYTGGPGAVFWMWVTAIFLAATSFTECSLGQLYKIRVDGEYRGGAYYCAERALGWKWFGVLFAFVTMITMLALLPGVQSNTISEGLYNSLGIPHWITGIVGAVLLGIIILGGIKRISGFAAILVPLKIGLFILLTIVVLAFHAQAIPATFVTIFTAAFNQGAVFGGAMGAAISMGVRRATFASGAGMGEETPAASAAETDHPVGQGLANSFGIYMDILICTCTALMILVTDCFNTASGYVGSGSPAMAELAKTGQNGIVFAQEAVGTIAPGVGEIVVGVLVILFAFTTILSYSYQAETSFAYIFGNARPAVRKWVIFGMRVMVLVFYIFFANTASTVAWGAADLGVGLMVWLNVFMLVFLFPKALRMFKDYEAQKKAGQRPFFDPEKVGIKNAELWSEINKDKIEAARAGEKVG